MSSPSLAATSPAKSDVTPTRRRSAPWTWGRRGEHGRHRTHSKKRAHHHSAEIEAAEENTVTLHIWAVATACASGQTTQRRCAACASLLLVTMQVMVLTIVNYTSSHPACLRNEDCRAGEFCFSTFLPWDADTQHNPWHVPRCLDCEHVFWAIEEDYLNVTACEFQRDGWAPISPSTAALSRKTLGRTQTSAWVPQRSSLSTTQQQCAALRHCLDTDRDRLVCDLITNNLERLHWTDVGLLLFCAMLLTKPIAEDMDQASLEEAVLDDLVRKGARPPFGSALRLSLRVRNFHLPCLSALTAAAVVMTNSLDATVCATAPDPSAPRRIVYDRSFAVWVCSWCACVLVS
jgi:hypothetical protein